MSVTKVALISHTSREAERRVTLAAFHALGLHPRVFIDANVKPSGTHEVGKRVLEWAASEGSHLLFLEDDVTPHPKLLNWLDVEDKCVSFCMMNPRNYPPFVLEMIKRGKPVEGLFRARNIHAWFGSQAILLPARVVRELLRTYDSVGDTFDMTLRALFFSEPLFFVTPNPVQHRALPHVKPRPRKRPAVPSVCYHLNN